MGPWTRWNSEPAPTMRPGSLRRPTALLLRLLLVLLAAAPAASKVSTCCAPPTAALGSSPRVYAGPADPTRRGAVRERLPGHWRSWGSTQVPTGSAQRGASGYAREQVE